MSLSDTFGATILATINSSANPVVNCRGASGVLVHINSVSSLTFTAQVALDSGSDYSTVPITNFKTGTVTAAGTAITPSADDLYFIPSGGASKLQLVRGAGSGTVSMQPVFAVSGAGSGSSTGPLGIGKAEDAAHASGDVGVMSLAVRNDANTALSSADGDYTPIAVDAQGFQRRAVDSITISIAPAVVTGAHAANELLFDLTALANAVRVNGGTCWLTGITVFDKDNEKAQIDFAFCQATGTVASGGGNSAPDITDANFLTAKPVQAATVSATDYRTISGMALACVTFQPKQINAGAATTSIFVFATVPGTPNYTATSDLVFDFHFLRA